MSAPRVALAGVFHESNTFVPRRTDLAAFGAAWHEGPAVIEALAGTQTVVGGFVDGGRSLGFDLRPALHAWATPAGPVEPAAFDALCAALVRTLQAVGEVDGVLLELHGAMVVPGRPGADGELAATVRRVVGALPIVAVIDPHANVPATLLEAVDLALAYRTNPHVDMAERGMEAAQLLAGLLADGAPRPRKAAVRVPLTAPAIAQATADEPLRTLLDAARAVERDPAVTSASLAFGFAYADVAELALTCLVAARDDATAVRHARALAAAAWAHRESFARDLASPAEAVGAAAGTGGPVALVDTGDNVGGGAVGDSTALASEVLAHGGLHAATTICDPAAVARAAAAGAGARIELVVGDPPLRLPATVRAIRDGCYVNDGPLSAGVEFDMGRVAILDAGPLVVVLQSRAVMANDQNMLRSMGVEPRELDAVILKGAAAVRAGWASCVRQFIDVATPGPTTSDLSLLAYRHAPRPLWPVDRFDWSPEPAPVSAGCGCAARSHRG